VGGDFAPPVGRAAGVTGARLHVPKVLSPREAGAGDSAGACADPLLAGCSSQSLIVGDHEVEQNAGLTVGLYALPGAELKAVHFTQEQGRGGNGSGYWHLETEVEPGQSNGWLAFIDPFHLDSETWLKTWNEAYAPLPVLGGLASGDSSAQTTQVYLNGEVYEEGGVAISIAARCGWWALLRRVHTHRRHLDAHEGGAEHHSPDRQPPGLRGAGGDVQPAYAEQQKGGGAICSSDWWSTSTWRISTAGTS